MTTMKNAVSMKGSRRLAGAAMLGSLGLVLGGCNTSNNALLEANRALTDRNTALTQQNESLQRLNQELQAALAARDKAINELNMLVADMKAGRGDLEGRLAALNDKFGSLRFGNLDPATDAALQALAAQHPDMLEYDPARGLLRFKSDVTFDSGSDRVRDQAQSTLTALANILNNAAAQYDVRIVGHTDSQRLSGPTAQKHTSNLRLSADRAIAVRNVLVQDGVSAPRFEVGGRGEFDPMVANTGNGNTPQNRRVEIFLTKAYGSRIPVNATTDTAPIKAAPAPAPSRPAANEEIMK